MYLWLKKALIAGLICGVFISCGITVREFLTTSDIFTISAVEVQAGRNTDVKKTEDTYNILIGKNIFEEIPEKLLFYSDPWISGLEIKRVLPDKVVVYITEDEGVLNFRRDGACFALTVSGKEIPFSCESVLVTISGRVSDEELREFIRLYHTSPTMRGAVVLLKPGTFQIDLGSYKITASYEKGVFERNMRTFMQHVRQRYNSFESIDISVRGRVYVKGGQNG